MISALLALLRRDCPQLNAQGIELLRSAPDPALLALLWSSVTAAGELACLDLEHHPYSHVPTLQPAVMACLIDLTPPEILRQHHVVSRIRHLTLRGVLPDPDKFAVFAALEHLRLERVRLHAAPAVAHLAAEDAQIDALAILPGAIRSLTLTRCQCPAPLQSVGPPLQRLHLEEVDIRQWRGTVRAEQVSIVRGAWGDALTAFTHTHTLSLEGAVNQIPTLPPSIEELTVQVEGDGAAPLSLEGLCRLRHLRVLRVNGGTVGTLAPLAGLQGLRALTINGQGHLDLQPLAPLSGLLRIEVGPRNTTTAAPSALGGRVRQAAYSHDDIAF